MKLNNKIKTIFSTIGILSVFALLQAQTSDVERHRGLDQDKQMCVNDGGVEKCITLDGPTGNLGIGTTSPGARFEAATPTGGTGLLVTSNGAGEAANTAAAINAEGNTSSYNILTLGSLDSGVRAVFRADGNVGIGTTSPTRLLHLQESVSPGITLTNSTTGSTTSDGTQLELTDSAGSFRILQRESANITLGVAGGPNGGDDFVIRNITGNVGIGTTSPNQPLEVNGNSFISGVVYIAANTDANGIHNASHGGSSTTMYIGNASINVTSDARLKNVIGPSSVNAVDLLNKLDVVDFTWKDPSDTSFNNRNARGTWTGVLAQQVVEHIPTMVNAPRKEDDLSIDYDSTSTWQLDPTAALPLLIKAVQELKDEIDTLKVELQTLRQAQ